MNWQKFYDYLENKGRYYDHYFGCVEPGYDDKDIIISDWNKLPNKTWEFVENKLNMYAEFYDEWIGCDACYKGFRISPDSYQWQMFGYIFDGYALCGNCIAEDPNDYIEIFINNPKNAITHPIYSVLDLEKLGWELVQNNYESGLYRHTNDDPTKILNEAIKNNPEYDYIFVMTDSGQFSVGYSLFKRKK